MNDPHETKQDPFGHKTNPAHATRMTGIGEFIYVDTPFLRVLDVGCSEGFMTARLSTYADGTVGIDVSEVAIKRDLVAQARRVVAIVDSSKWGRVGFASFASVDQLDCVITDVNAPPDMVAALRGTGVDMVIV